MLMAVTFFVFSFFMALGAFYSATSESWLNALGYAAFAILLARFAWRAFKEAPRKNRASGIDNDSDSP